MISPTRTLEVHKLNKISEKFIALFSLNPCSIGSRTEVCEETDTYITNLL